MSVHDYFYAGMAARELSMVYNSSLLPSEAIRWADTAKALFKRADKPEHAAWIDVTRVNAHNHAANLDSVLKICEEADSALMASNEYFRNRIQSLRAQTFGYSRMTREASEAFKEVVRQGYELTGHDNILLADCYLHDGHLDSAAYYLRAAAPLLDSPEDSLYYDKISFQLLGDSGRYHEAFAIARGWGDRLTKYYGRHIYDPDLLMLHEYLDEKQRLEQARSREVASRALIAALAAAVLILIAVTVIVWQRVRLARMDACNKRQAYELSGLKYDLTLMARTHREDVTGLMSKYIVLIDSICEKLCRASADGKEAGRNAMKCLRDSAMTEDLERIIDSNHEGWMGRFRSAFPSMAEDDYRLVMCLFLGFRNQSIAILLDKPSVQAVYSAKFNLKERLTRIDAGMAGVFLRDMHFKS